MERFLFFSTTMLRGCDEILGFKIFDKLVVNDLFQVGLTELGV